ncbi:unnamed protein product [Malus baccata var. baccata]
MEVSFLASNSFTKTVTSPNRNFTQFQSKRVGIPSSITCSRGESSTLSNDDHKPSIDADCAIIQYKTGSHREIKVKRATSTSSLDLDIVVDQPKPITVCDK